MNNDLEKIKLKDRQLERKRRARRRKERARRRFYFVVTIIVLLIFSFTLRKRHSRVAKNLDSNSDYVTTFLKINMRENQLNPINFNIKKDDVKALSYIAEVRASRIKKKLVPGENHITTAAKYAYDTKWVRDVTTGKVSYEGNKKLVFLTFDDGPNTTITPQVLKTLKANGVRGTFFVVGRAINDKSSRYLKEALVDGNAIAMHSYTHDYHLLYPERSANDSQVSKEADLLSAKLKSILGENFASHVWRYPGGHMSWDNIEGADSALASRKIIWIDWNCLSGDAEPKAVRPSTPEGMVRYIDRSLHQNEETRVAVVLMHDAMNKQHTVNALPSIINYFKERGYEFALLK